jgi:peptidoglycan-associated lipoprotein
MRSVRTRALAGGVILALASLGLGGCATQGYVDKQVAGVQSQVDGLHTSVASLSTQVASNSERIGQNEQRIAKLDSDTKLAMAKADAAGGDFIGTQLAAETVHFKTASAQLTDQDKATLTALAEKLKSENKDVRLEIYGHTDAQGSMAYNDHLGEKRAEEVYDFLGKQGVPLNKMALLSKSEEEPAADNSTKEGRAQNRRAVVSVIGKS